MSQAFSIECEVFLPFAPVPRYKTSPCRIRRKLMRRPLNKRRQIDRSAETQQLLIEAAIEMLCEKGFAGATTANIAASAGVTTGALHHHFATKDDLLFGVLDYVSERIVLEFRLFSRKSSGQSIDLQLLVRQLWSIYGGPQYWSVWEIIMGSREDERMRERLLQHRERTMEALNQCWLTLNPSLTTIDQRTARVLDLLLSSIRGLCMDRFVRTDERYFHEQLTLLVESIEPIFAKS